MFHDKASKAQTASDADAPLNPQINSNQQSENDRNMHTYLSVFLSDENKDINQSLGNYVYHNATHIASEGLIKSSRAISRVR
jgi:hypothetical protein